MPILCVLQFVGVGVGKCSRQSHRTGRTEINAPCMCGAIVFISKSISKELLANNYALLIKSSVPPSDSNES